MPMQETQETRAQSLGQEGKKAQQPTLVLVPGEFPWTKEPDGLQSMRSHRVGHWQAI